MTLNELHDNFQYIIIASWHLKEKDNNGVKDSDLSVAFLHDTPLKNDFLALINDDISPQKALSILAKQTKDKLLSRENFLLFVIDNHLDKELNLYEKLQEQYQNEINSQYELTVQELEKDLIQISDAKNLYGYEAFKIIENTVKFAQQLIIKRDEKRGLDSSIYINFLETILKNWEDAFFKRQPNNVHKAFVQLANISKQEYFGTHKRFTTLASDLSFMVYYDFFDIKDNFIIALAKSFEGDLLHVKSLSICAMDKRTFETRIKKPELQKIIDDIKTNASLKIDL